jgi:hypothetical protein
MIAQWPTEIDNFKAYFLEQWIQSPENGWFEGHSIYCTSNNGLESQNREIKRNHTLRKMMPFKDFLRVATDIVNHWSTIYKVILD